MPTAKPALLMSTAMFLHFPVRLCMAVFTSSDCRMSKLSVSTSTPFFRMVSASSWSRSFRRPVMMMSNPASAAFDAVAFPIPEVAPVMSAILFILFILWFLLIWMQIYILL